MPKRLLILTAMEMEAKAVARGLGPRARDGSIEIRTIGPAACRLPTGLRRDEIAGIVMAGLGGGIDPSLKLGDVIVDAESDLTAYPFRLAPIATVDHIVGTPSEKEALFRSTGAVIVEMENAIVRKMARELGVPFLGVRAVSDAQTDPLDPAVLGFLDERGKPKLGAIVRALCARPMLLKHLLRLRRASIVSLSSLGQAVGQLITEGNFPP